MSQVPLEILMCEFSKLLYMQGYRLFGWPCSVKVVKVSFVYYKTNQLVFLLSVCEYTLFAVENVQKKFY